MASKHPHFGYYVVNYLYVLLIMKTFECFRVIGTIPIAIGFTELLAGVDKFLRQRISWILLVLTVTELLHTTNQKKYKCV